MEPQVQRKSFNERAEPSSAPRAGPSSARQLGLSLVEVAIGVVAMAVVVGASGTAVHMVAHSGTTAEKQTQERAALSIAANRLCHELSMAVQVTELTGTSITFSTQNTARDGTQTLRYALESGKLTRQVNGSTAVPIIDPCAEFAMMADVEGVLTDPMPTDSAELTVAEHQSYPSIALITTAENSISTSSWQAQTFVPTSASATSFKVSGVTVTGRRMSTSTTGTLTAQIRPVQAGTDDPTSTVIDQATFDVSLLSTSAAAIPMTFTNPTPLTIGQKYAVVFLSSRGDTNVRITYDSISLEPPDDQTVYRRTTNSGGSWTPMPGLNLRDTKFQLRGRYQTADSNANRAFARGRLRSLCVHLAPLAGHAGMTFDGGVVCLNQPDMTGFVANDLPLIRQPN